LEFASSGRDESFAPELQYLWSLVGWWLIVRGLKE
jgi:hypothetical protein